MSSDTFTVGYIGLGIMGRSMAANLASAGYPLVVWNRTRAKCEPLEADGAAVADSPRAMAAGDGVPRPEAIFLNVTDTPDVETVLFGDDGIAAADDIDGLIVVDNSTISPVATKRFAERLADHGATLIDAPVSGGDTGAKAGTLSIMCGGPSEAFGRVRPLLEVLGKSVTHLGPAGSGQACKACNQVAVSCCLMGVVEAMALAARSGLDPAQMAEVVAAGAGGSWQMSNLAPKIAAGDFEPGFFVDYVLKDLAIVADTARAHALPMMGTSTAEAYFRAAAAHGHGRAGTQAMAKTIERLGHFSFSGDME